MDAHVGMTHLARFFFSRPSLCIWLASMFCVYLFQWDPLYWVFFSFFFFYSCHATYLPWDDKQRSTSRQSTVLQSMRLYSLFISSRLDYSIVNRVWTDPRAFFALILSQGTLFSHFDWSKCSKRLQFVVCELSLILVEGQSTWEDFKKKTKVFHFLQRAPTTSESSKTKGQLLRVLFYYILLFP